MNFAEAIAFSALIIGLISGGGIWFSAYERRLKNRERELELHARIAEAEANSSRSELGQLEQRTRVLERIATDNKTKLAHQIEALRDQRKEVL